MQRTTPLSRYRFDLELHAVATAIVLSTGLLISEGLLYLGWVTFALTGHLVLLVVCTAVPMYFDSDLALYQGFVLLPVFRIVNFGLPVVVDTTLYWYPLVYGSFLPAIVLIAWYTDAIELDVGWRTAALLHPFILVASVYVAAAERTLYPVEGVLSSTGLVEFLVLAVVMIGFVATVEELLFRGLLQESLQAHLGAWPGVVASSLVYATMHSVYRTPDVFAFAFGFGLFVGALYYKTRSLATVVLLHGAVNVFVFGIFPITGPWVAIP